MRSCFVPFVAVAALSSHVAGFSLKMVADQGSASRRSFLTTALSSAAAIVTAVAIQAPQSALAAPQIFNTESGIKYAVLKDAKGTVPRSGDIVAIEYTGYLTTGSIFDATHAEGKNNVLLFNLGGNAVIPGINEMVENMSVGQKVQCIIPPNLAFGEKGICVEGGECLVKPGATLVYDIFLKKSAIPPP
jgi:FKBP-type peptidyl-prolyl cis-trans isomerase